MAPAFNLSSQEGTPVSLQDFRGKWVVLYFYPKDFTSGCTIQAHGFQVDLAKYTAINAEILGVSVDSADSHKDFCAKEGLNFKLLSDTNREVVTKYGSTRDATPTSMAARNTFIVSPQGKIAKVFLAVQPTKHSAEVLEALAELQKAK
jgi:peroxiredoxin Q/BCP